MEKKNSAVLVIVVLILLIAIFGFWAYKKGLFNQYLPNDQEDVSNEGLNNNGDYIDPALNDLDGKGGSSEVSEKGEEGLLSLDVIDELNGQENKQDICDIDIETLAANEDYLFENDVVSFYVPYNEDWKLDDYYLSPYEEKNYSIYFGPAVMDNDCNVSRQFVMTAMPYKSQSYLKTFFENKYGSAIQKIEIDTINGYQVVKMIASGNCDFAVIEVVGLSENYQFYSTCSTDPDGDMEILEKIIETFNFSGSMLG